jgi:hypothetical protein
MPKLPDWESRLGRLVSETHGRRFAWGDLDCCLWAAAAVEAQTGVDHAEGIRGTYDDAAGAARVVRRMGGLRGIGALAGPVVAPLMVRHGDIGIVRSNGKPVLAVFGGQTWLVVTSQGLLNLPLGAATHCWRTGDA